jgi:hypothetical protein
MQLSPATFDRSRVEAPLSPGKDNNATLHRPQVNESDPFDRRAQLSTLLARIQTGGAQPHEQEIDQIRTFDRLSEIEREIVLEIFRFGYEAAEKEHREDKMWAYQRLLRRLLLHQPLDQPIPLTTPSDEIPRERIAQPESATIEKKAQSQESTPNRFTNRALRRRFVRYGVFLGGAAALLWIVYADPSLIGGRHLYSLANVNPRNSVPALPVTKQHIGPAIPAGESAGTAELESLIERASVTQPEPATDRDLSGETRGAVTENTQVATARAMVQSSKLNSSAAESNESPPLAAPLESVNSSLKIYRTVRQILLREEPRFGAASQIMLDQGARLMVLEINGSWLKVRMEKTGAIGFVREEFVMPAEAAGPSSANNDKSPS